MDEYFMAWFLLSLSASCPGLAHRANNFVRGVYNGTIQDWSRLVPNFYQNDPKLKFWGSHQNISSNENLVQSSDMF